MQVLKVCCTALCSWVLFILFTKSHFCAICCRHCLGTYLWLLCRSWQYVRGLGDLWL